MTTDDLDDVWAINELNTGDVGAIKAEELADILSSSEIALVAVGPEDELVGFCLVVDSASRPQTERAAWAFASAHPDLHLERVAFDMRYSGYGLGLALYDELDRHIERFAAASASPSIRVSSLVRLEPPNEHAIGFHAKRGFETVAQADFDDVTVGVAVKTYTA